jgi:hypothetical protein
MEEGIELDQIVESVRGSPIIEPFLIGAFGADQKTA